MYRRQLILIRYTHIYTNMHVPHASVCTQVPRVMLSPLAYTYIFVLSRNITQSTVCSSRRLGIPRKYACTRPQVFSSIKYFLSRPSSHFVGSTSRRSSAAATVEITRLRLNTHPLPHRNRQTPRCFRRHRTTPCIRESYARHLPTTLEFRVYVPILYILLRAKLLFFGYY